MRKTARIIIMMIIIIGLVGCKRDNEGKEIKEVGNNEVIQEIKIPEIQKVIEYMYIV